MITNNINNYKTESIIDIFSEINKSAEKDKFPWRERFISLLTIIAAIVSYEKDNNQKEINEQRILELLEFPKLISIYNENTLPDDIKEQLGIFLNSILNLNIGNKEHLN